jgi:DNA-binding HxlR family transcriptional regulator
VRPLSGSVAATSNATGCCPAPTPPSVPVRVDYALTPLGQSLLPVVEAIKHWAETHIEDVETARADYDTRGA